MAFEIGERGRGRIHHLAPGALGRGLCEQLGPFPHRRAQAAGGNRCADGRSRARGGGGEVENKIRGGHRAVVLHGMGLIGGEEEHRARPHVQDLAVHIHIERAVAQNDQLFLRMRVRRMRGETGIERADVALEFFKRRRGLVGDIAALADGGRFCREVLELKNGGAQPGGFNSGDHGRQEGETKQRETTEVMHNGVAGNVAQSRPEANRNPGFFARRRLRAGQPAERAAARSP